MNSRKAFNGLSRVCILVMALSALFFWGCDDRPRVTIEGGAIPVFKVSGSGSIQVISVDGPDFANPKSHEPGSRYMKPYWQIAPEVDYDLRRLEKSGGLVYGQVPEGFRQVFPENGVAPQSLSEDELFTFALRVANGGAIGVRFAIHNGKPAAEGS